MLANAPARGPSAPAAPAAPAASPTAPRKTGAVARRTQLERRSEAEARLLVAAREIISKKGWVGMTLAEVGIAAGYSKGLAAHHFGSKARLLRAVAAQINDEFMREVGCAPQRRAGLDALIGFVETYLDRRDKRWVNTRALLVLMAEATMDDSETGASLGQFNRSVAALVEQHFHAGMRNGDMRSDIEPAAGAVIVIGALRGVMMQRLLKNSSVDIKAVRRALVGMLIRSFARIPESWTIA